MPTRFTFKKKILQLFFKFASISLIIIAFGSFFILKTENDKTIINTKKTEISKLQLQVDEITNNFVFIKRDILFLRDLVAINEICSCSDKTQFNILEKAFSKFIKQKKQYDQLRLIDNEGMEQIRVENSSEGVILINQSLLQDKSKRYYFEDISKLSQNDVYLSKFDLNVENLHVEIPYKPIVRIGMKIPDCYGDFCGIVLINYLGEGLINKLEQLNHSSPGNIHLINPDGYFLISPDESQNWGFMFEDRKDKTYTQVYSQAWKIIKSNDTGQLRNEDGLFTFQTLSFNPQNKDVGVLNDFSYFAKDNYWKIISFIPDKELTNLSIVLLAKYYFPLILIIILSLVHICPK